MACKDLSPPCHVEVPIRAVSCLTLRPEATGWVHYTGPPGWAIARRLLFQPLPCGCMRPNQSCASLLIAELFRKPSPECRVVSCGHRSCCRPAASCSRGARPTSIGPDPRFPYSSSAYSTYSTYLRYLPTPTLSCVCPCRHLYRAQPTVINIHALAGNQGR